MKINLKKYFETTNITKFCTKYDIKKRTFEDIYYGITLNPRIDILYKIAKALNVKVDDLIEENINNILKYMKNKKPNFINVRNYLIILLLNDTGARINEIVNIELKNIKNDFKAIYLSFTKTNKPRWVFLQEETINTLKTYLKWHNENKYLLLSEFGEQIKRDSIYNFIEKLKNDLKINQSITPHKWRHTFATNLIRNKVNLEVVMDVLGHTEYTTTKRYLHLEIEERQEIILKALKKSVD